jgi:hypothetical protein
LDEGYGKQLDISGSIILGYFEQPIAMFWQNYKAYRRIYLRNIARFFARGRDAVS